MTKFRFGPAIQGFVLFTWSSAVLPAFAMAQPSNDGKPPEQTGQNLLRDVSQAGGPGSSYLPVFESQVNEFLGLSLVNRAMVDNDITVSWTRADGSDVREGRLSLAPGSQRIRLVREILDLPSDPTEGWLRVDAAQPGLFTYLTAGSDELLDGAGPANDIATSIILEHVEVNTGFVELRHTDTLVQIINPNAAVAGVRTELVNLDGVIVGNLTLSIAPRAARTMRISESFRNALPANNVGGHIFNGYLRLASDIAVSGWLRIDTPLSRRLVGGRASADISPSRLATVAYFASGGPAPYHSELNLINAGEAAITLELSARNSRGEIIGEAVRRTLGPGEGIREDVMGLFRVVTPAVFPPPTTTGYIRIQSADGAVFRVIGDISISSGDLAASMVYPITTEPLVDWILPFATAGPDYFTGYAIANPNELLAVQTDVTIELFDQDGRLAGPPRSISLSPLGQFVGLVEQPISAGYLRIRSNLPVVVLGSIGASNGSTLLPLPAMK
jgi:hypothetical protein